MKLFRKITGIFMILILAFAVVLFSASLFLQKEVSGIILRSLNKNLSTKLETGSFRLSFLRRFPKASLELRDVLVRSSADFKRIGFKENADTLLFAKNVSMKFSITDMLRGKYTIESVSARSGIARFLTDSTGSVNYNISTGGQGKDALIIDLEKINLSNIDAVYNDLSARLIISGMINSGKLKSRISGENIDFSADAELQMKKFTLYDFSVTHPAKAKLGVELQSTKDGVRFRKGNLSLDDNYFTLNGFVSSENFLDLAIEGQDIDTKKLMDYLPEKYSKIRSLYDPSGKIKLNCTVKGFSDKTSDPHVEMNYSLANALVSFKGSKVSLNKISFVGQFTNGMRNSFKTCSASFNDLKFSLGSSEYSGSFKITDFRNPVSEITMKGRVLPAELKEFFDIKKITSATGSAYIDLKLVTRFWPKDSVTPDDIIDLRPEAKIDFQAMTLGSPGWLFKNVNGTVYASETLRPENLSFEYEGQKITVTGDFRNLPEWLAGRHIALHADADVSFDRFIPEVFLKNDQGSAQNKKGTDFPDNLFLDVRFAVDGFGYKKFSASGIKGEFSYKPRLLTFKSLRMNTLKGSVSGNGFIIQNSNRSFTSRGFFDVGNIDINGAFTTFNNFGQEFIIAKNLSGSLSGDISVLIPMNSSFRPDEKTVAAEGKFIITNGALIDFGPVKELSSFIELSELQNIHFDRLENDFFIRKNTFFMPQMDVRSSAADLTVNGQHTFDNNYQYHVKMLLSQLLSKKRKKKPSVTEFGAVQDDGLGRTSILMKVENKGEDVKVSYDLKAVSQNIKNNIKSEKQTMKSILNEEYGWYKDDPALQKTEAPQQQKKSRFSITWDGTDSLSNDAVEKKPAEPVIKSLFRKK